MNNMTKREKEVLTELLKDGRVGDQQIARKIKTSRPTVAKVRKRLEEKGIILRYATKTNWERVGLHITAVTIFKWDDYSKKKELEDNIKYINARPEVVMFIRGTGMSGKTKLIISIH